MARASEDNSHQILRINVALPSGKRKRLAVLESSKVGDLIILAQESFGQSFLRLVTAQGHVLNDQRKSLQAAGIQDGDHITAIAQQKAQLAATAGAFALWRCRGDTVVTWGDSSCGGDSSEVQDQLRSVQQVQASYHAFAAVLADGSVITWGHEEWGGDSSAVQDQLRNVQQLQATDSAFAALLADGSVVTWAIQKMVATPLLSKISSGMYSISMPRMAHLLPSWKMDPWLRGDFQIWVATVLLSKISSGV